MRSRVDELAAKAVKVKETATLGSCLLGGVAMVVGCAGSLAMLAGLLYLIAWAIGAGWQAGVGG